MGYPADTGRGPVGSPCASGGKAEGELLESRRETYYDDEEAFYWMYRDEERGSEPLSWLGNHFPQGCRFCM